MGVSVSHGGGDWSYSGFGTWRTIIAKAAGRATEFDERDGHERYVIENPEQYHRRTYDGWWDEAPDDALDVLLVHSDCDGWIFPQHAEALAKRLDELAPLIADTYHRDATYRFASGLRSAAEDWQIVRFS